VTAVRIRRGSLPEATHAYVAYRPCGHPEFLAVDDPNDSLAYRRDLGRTVAQLVADDRRIERVTIEEARVIGVVYCACVPTMREAEITVRRRKRRRAF
jgi:hypothetical protein